MPAIPRSVIALDVGTKRVGVAIASLDTKLPRPFSTLNAEQSELVSQLQSIIDEEDVGRIVIGLPRGLSGQETSQTEYTLKIKDEISKHLDVPIDMQDEALTSSKAKEELSSRGKPYKPEDIDALAATYILDDWFADQQELSKK